MCGVTATRPLFKQSVLIAPKVGIDREGSPQYGLAKEYRARIVERFRRIVNQNGEEVISSITVNLMEPDIDVNVESKITVNGRSPMILAVESYPCEVGHNHRRVLT